MKQRILLFLIIFVVSCSERDPRKKVVVIDSGVNLNSEINRFLCKEGHKSFLQGRLWNQDKIGHGTTIVEILIKKLDSKRHCIVVLKTADRGVESKKRAEAYAIALMNLASKDFNVLVLALEDTGYFFKEIDWFNALLSKTKTDIVVAAGNGGVQLRENKDCNVYPACLRSKLRNKHRFHIVGSTDGRFNKGPLITANRNSRYKGKSGTSLSAAVFASELMD
jgi:hypothetical protein